MSAITCITLHAFGLLWQVPQASAMQLLRAGSNDAWPLRDIILVAGQSNAVGLGLTSELPADQASPPANVLAWPWDVQPLIQGDRFGPELSFAQDVAKVYEQRQERFGILKVARIGVGLRHDWTLSGWEGLVSDTPKLRQLHALGDLQEQDDNVIDPNATASEQPYLFALLVDNARKAMKSVQCDGRCRIRAVLWLQGEKDANSVEDADLYGSELTTFMDTLRSALDSPDLFVVIAGLAPDLVGMNWKPGADVVLAAQHNYTVMQGPSRAAFVPTDGVPKLKDKLHYSTAGLLDLGHRLAKACTQAL